MKRLCLAALSPVLVGSALAAEPQREAAYATPAADARIERLGERGKAKVRQADVREVLIELAKRTPELRLGAEEILTDSRAELVVTFVITHPDGRTEATRETIEFVKEEGLWKATMPANELQQLRQSIPMIKDMLKRIIERPGPNQ